MKPIVFFLTFILLMVLGFIVLFAAQQPPFTVDDTAANENFRVVYYLMDSHRHSGTDESYPIYYFASGFAPGGLAQGTTFMRFDPDDNVQLFRMNVTYTNLSIGGAAPDTWICGGVPVTGSTITVVAPRGASPGTVFSSTGPAYIVAHSSVNCWLASDATTTPGANVVLEMLTK